jgi:hypothetical protein
MARVQSLTEMVSNLRAEAGHSLNIAQGSNTESTLKYILKRTQEELWTAFTWPEMVLRDDRPLTAGVYLYGYGTTLKFDAIREAWAANSNDDHWSPIAYGIDESMLLAGSPGNSTTSDPVARWEAAGPTQFRVWPTPQATGGYVRFKGNRELNPLVSSGDNCTLDATCIILFAASELLARSKAEDAANKLQKAQRHLTKLLGNQVSAKNKVSTYGTWGGRDSNAVRPTAIVGYP